MFTGIIQELGQILSVEKKPFGIRYTVNSPLQNLKKGCSIAVDGVCQTLVDQEGGSLTFDAIPETLERTTLQALKQRQKVNLERSLRLGEEVGGHLLSGHIYGMATLVSIDEAIFTFSIPQNWTKYLFSKGFIALDGASLTLVSVDQKRGLFTVHLIPETLSRTTLGLKTVGERVNLEIDAQTQTIVETVERALEKRELLL